MASSEGATIGPEGELLRTSPSAIETFRRCPTSWYLRYVSEKQEKILAAIRNAQGLGTLAHAQLEQFLKDGVIPVDVFAVALLPFAPPRGPGLVVEGSTSGLVAAGIPVRGRIDWAHGRIPSRPIVADWKTRKDLDKYAKTPAELKKDVQMLCYAKWALSHYTDAESVDVAHFYVETKNHQRGGVLLPGAEHLEPKPRVATVLVNFSREDVEQGWAGIVATVEEMVAVARARSAALVAHPEDLKAPGSPCQAFGGCGYRWCCPHQPGNKLLTRLKERSEHNTMATLSEILAAKAAGKPASTAPGEGILPPDMPGNVPAPVPAPIPTRELIAEKDGTLVGTFSVVPPPNAETHRCAYSLLGTCSECGNKRRGRPKKTPPAHPDSLSAVLLPAGVDPVPALGPVPAPAPGPSAGADLVPSQSGGEAGKAARQDFVESEGVSPTEASRRFQRLYINCYSTAKALDLNEYAADTAAMIAYEAGLPDIRCAADKSSPLAYGGWKGVLAATVRAEPPARSVGFIVTRGDEIAEVVAAALAPLYQEVVRG